MACGHEVPMKGIISARADWNVVTIMVVSGIEIPMKGTLSRLRATHIATKSPSGTGTPSGHCSTVVATPAM